MSDSSPSTIASDALQVLTEQVFNNIKLATPALEELLKASQKYHIAMEQSNIAAQNFVDVIGKVAVTASRGRAATHALGQAMQNLVSKHQQIVTNREDQTRKIQTQLITPLQKRLRAELKSLAKMEEDFKTMTKQFKSELKKAGQVTVKAQKTAAKKDGDERAQSAMQHALKAMLHKSKSYESFNQRCLRATLIEERRRYCYLMDNYISVFEDDFRFIGSQDLVKQVLDLSQEPEKLPEDSLELISKNGSNGLMFEVPDDTNSLRDIEPSPLTRELSERFHRDHAALPPGCPPGGNQVSNRHFKLQIIKFTLVAIRAKYKGEKTPSINVDTDSSCIFISLTTKSLKKRDVPYNL
eukprot:gene576-3893_t